MSRGGGARRGLTLIEVLVAVVVLSGLAVALLPLTGSLHRQRSQGGDRIQAMDVLRQIARNPQVVGIAGEHRYEDFPGWRIRCAPLARRGIGTGPATPPGIPAHTWWRVTVIRDATGVVAAELVVPIEGLARQHPTPADDQIDTRSGS